MSTATVSQHLTSVGEDYRYKRFTTRLLLCDLRFRKDSAKPGDSFPSFELLTIDGLRLTNGDLFGDKPVLFIFGSMTCPMTSSAAPSVQKLYDRFGDRVTFVMLYVREAHPGETITQSESIDEKLEHARALKEFYGIDWTVAADTIDGDLHRALDPKPNSAFLMDSNGTIVFRSLWAADYDALSEALSAETDGRTPERNQSTAMLVPVARAMGHVQAVMERGGPQAVRDLWRGGLPMAAAGRLATFFSPLTPDQRGIAAVLTLALGTLAALGIFGTWIFA